MPPVLKPRRAASSKPLERDIQAEIREALGLEPDLVLWRNAQSFAEVWDPETATVRMHHGGLGTGSSDLVGILSMLVFDSCGAPMMPVLGRFFALEIKQVGKKPNPDQLAWLSLVRRMGGFATWVDCVAAARAALERARKGENQ